MAIVLAIPSTYIFNKIRYECKYIRKDDMIILKKTNILDECGCGARHWYFIKLPKPITGGIKLFRKEEIVDVGRRKIKKLMERKEKYFYILRYVNIEENGSEGLKDTIFKGWLVFEELEDRYKITKKEPTHWCLIFTNRVNSREHSASVELLNENDAIYKEYYFTACAIESVASVIAILPLDKPAIVKYVYDAPYRGGEPIYKKVKITPNLNAEWDNLLKDVHYYNIEDYEEIVEGEII